MIPLNFIHAPPPFADNSRGTLEATKDAFIQIGNSGHLLMAIVGQYTHVHLVTIANLQITSKFSSGHVFAGISFSIAFFNFAGISVTKEMSATTRMILDSVRTIVIWAFSLAFGWQAFHYLQVNCLTFILVLL